MQTWAAYNRENGIVRTHKYWIKSISLLLLYVALFFVALYKSGTLSGIFK